MDAPELILTLERRGLRLYPESGRLIVRAGASSNRCRPRRDSSPQERASDPTGQHGRRWLAHRSRDRRRPPVPDARMPRALWPGRRLARRPPPARTLSARLARPDGATALLLRLAMVVAVPARRDQVLRLQSACGPEPCRSMGLGPRAGRPHPRRDSGGAPRRQPAAMSAASLHRASGEILRFLNRGIRCERVRARGGPATAFSRLRIR